MNRNRTSVVIALGVLLSVGCAELDVAAPPNATTPGHTTMIDSGSPLPRTGDETAITERDAPPSGGVFFPQQQPGHMSYPDAMGGGKLVVDEEGCLRTKVSADDPGTVPLWPSGFELDATDNKIRVLDRNGQFVARVGDEVEMGGGNVERVTLEDNAVLDERTRQELFERCPERTYFLAQPDMRLKR